MTAESRNQEPQFENPDTSKLKDETADGAPRKQLQREAEKLAQKSTKVEQQADKKRSIFTK